MSFSALRNLLLASLAGLVLSACGSGSSGGSQLKQPSTSQSAAMTIAATDPNTGAGVTSISKTGPVTQAQITAVVTNGAGNPIDGVLVTFTASDTTAVTLSSTAVQTINGKATILVNANAIATPTAIKINAAGALNSISVTSPDLVLSVGAGTTTGSVGQPATAQYVGANPTRIVVDGGSAGAGVLTETSQIQFKILDANGATVPNAQATFNLSTTNGGLTFLDTTRPSCSVATPCGTVSVVSNSAGVVTATVKSGTAPESFLVWVTLPTGVDPTLKSYANDQLAVSGNAPSQYHFSMLFDSSATCPNPDATKGISYPCKIVISAGDFFAHPVPDGTVITFSGSTGTVVVGDADSQGTYSGYCKTKAGQCTANVVAGMGPGRNEIVAYAEAVSSTDVQGFYGNLPLPFSCDPNVNPDAFTLFPYLQATLTTALANPPLLQVFTPTSTTTNVCAATAGSVTTIFSDQKQSDQYVRAYLRW